MALHHIGVKDREDDTRVAVSVMGRNITERTRRVTPGLEIKTNCTDVVL